MRGFFVVMKERETRGNFSKSAVGKTANAFGTSTYEFVKKGPKGDVVRIRPRKGVIRGRLMPALAAAIYEPTSDPLVNAEFNKRLPVVADILLGNTVGVLNVRYINAIGGGDDLENVAQIAIDLAEDKADETGTVIRMVFGATEKMPVRALSYPLPVLQMMVAMEEIGITPPQLQLVFANNISAGINEFSQDEVAAQTKLFVVAEQEYLKRFFPELSDRVVFLEDVPLESVGTLANDLQAIKKAIEEKGDRELLAQLLSKGGKDSIAYGGAHLLFHDLAPEGLLKPVDGVVQPDMIIPQTMMSVGGRQEEIFYVLRMDAKKKGGLPFHANQRVKTVQFVTDHAVPPYRMAKYRYGDRFEDMPNGDIALQDVGRNVYGLVDPTVVFDFAYHLQVSLARSNFVEFLGEKRAAT